jgi:hypothetical protein
MKAKPTRQALDEALSEINFTNISDFRKIKNINPHFEYIDELKTIEGLFTHLLDMRKKGSSKYFFISSSMWELIYERSKNKYKKNEKYNLTVKFVPEEGAHEDYY